MDAGESIVGSTSWSHEVLTTDGRIPRGKLEGAPSLRIVGFYLSTRVVPAEFVNVVRKPSP